MPLTAYAMIALLAAAFAGFAYSALRRFRLLGVGAPIDRFDRLFDRMAGAPDHREATMGGTLLLALVPAHLMLAVLFAMSAFMSQSTDITPLLSFLAVATAAGAGGFFLIWALQAQMKMPKYPMAGLAHYMIFTGFAVLLLRTIILCGRAFDPHFNLWLLDPAGPMPWAILGKAYNVMKDLVVLGVLAGVLTFIRFRLLDKTKRLAYGWHAWVVLGVIGVMMLADSLYDAGSMAQFALERSAAGEGAPVAIVNEMALHDFSIMGFLGGRAILALGITSPGISHALGMLGFWTHVTLVWSFLNYLPYGKHFHVITALPNVLFRSLSPPGRLAPMAKTSDELMEQVGAAAELANPTDAPVGVAQIEHFSWKSILDFYTCTECGRCSDNCPAHRTGKILSPKHFTIDLRNHLYSRSDEILARKGGARGETVAKSPAPNDGTTPEEKPQDEAGTGAGSTGEAKPAGAGIQHVDLVPAVIDADVLWGCTTCRACEEQCPVMITYVDKIVDMRRNLVMVKGEFPHALQKTFTALETNGNPWNITRMDRGAWSEGMDIPLMSEKPDADVLYWVGCAGSYDDNAKKIARATARILKEAGVDFAILGSEETCTGDPARRAGNEYLYMMLAEQNVATLNQYKPRKIVTTCPHCFNSLLNEYPDLGGKYDVVHHSDFLLGLILEGKITPKRAVRAKVTFHDSCYLGRYNNVYDAPRELLKQIPGLQLVEPSWSREKGLCCGAGGAQMWMEEQNNDRVNKRRTLQLLDTGASTIASGCPFCHTMLTDGLKAFEGEPELNRPVEQLDIAVLLERSLGLSHEKRDSGAEVPTPDTSEPAAAEASS